MASGSMVSRILGIVRYALLIACIGGKTGAGTAFQTANTLPNTIFMLLSGGLLTSILIPQLTKAMKKDDGGQETIDALLTLSFLVVTAVTVIATVFAGPLISIMQLKGAVRDLGIIFAYLCLPQIFFYGAYVIWGQVLNVRDRFAEYMWTPVLANLVQIAGMTIFYLHYSQVPEAERWNGAMIWLLAGTTTAGIVIQALGLLPALKRCGFSWSANFRFRGHGFRQVGALAAWTITAVTIAQIGGFITQSAINYASENERIASGTFVANINIYTLAFTLFMVPFGIISVSILTAIYPRLARAVQDDNSSDSLHLTMQGIRLPMVILIPVTFAAVILASPGIATLSPALSPSEVSSTALCFSIMSLGLVSFSVSSLQQRFSIAREDGRTNLRYQMIVTGIQILVALAVITCIPARFAVTSVAIGQTVGNTVAALFFLTLITKEFGSSWHRDLLTTAAKMIVFSILPSLASWGAVRLLAMALSDGYLLSLTQLIVGGIVFCLGCALIAPRSSIPEVQLCVDKVKSRLGRSR